MKGSRLIIAAVSVVVIIVTVIVIVIATEDSLELPTVQRKIGLGIIEGKRLKLADGTYESYTGVPYAKPPVGRLRFQPPQPLDAPWEGTFHAKQNPPFCPQLQKNQVMGDEDCLYLIIYVPDVGKHVKDGEEAGEHVEKDNDSKRDSDLPVMVFIHGGAFVIGGSNPGEYGPELLIGQGVILVTINYRLGPLGFLSTETATAPGNLGLRDMILALNWVSENIVEFGGDAGRVTVFGESAGSMAISALLVTQAPFQRAILQSGSLVRPFFLQGLRDNRTQHAVQLGNAIGCSSEETSEDLVKCLQDIPVVEIVSASTMFDVHTAWQPIVDRFLGDQAILPLDPLSAISAGNAKDVNIMFGSNDGDGMPQLGKTVYSHPKFYQSLQQNFPSAGPLLLLGRKEPSASDILLCEKIKKFYLNDAEFSSQIDGEMMTLMTDNMYQAGTRRILDILVEQGRSGLYQYIFTYIGSVTNTEVWFNMTRPDLGACHADELYYLFSRDDESPLMTSQDVLVSDTMVKFWTNFAKTGNPNTPKNVEVENSHIWTQITKEKREYLNIGLRPVMELPESYKQRIKFWESIFEDLKNSAEIKPSTDNVNYRTARDVEL